MFWLLVACTVKQEDYYPNYWDVWCTRWEECDKGDFLTQYSDATTCALAMQTADQDHETCVQQECVFSPDHATKCLDYLRTESCDDWVLYDYGNDCADAWNCNADDVTECEAQAEQ